MGPYFELCLAARYEDDDEDVGEDEDEWEEKLWGLTPDPSLCSFSLYPLPFSLCPFTFTLCPLPFVLVVPVLLSVTETPSMEWVVAGNRNNAQKSDEIAKEQKEAG